MAFVTTPLTSSFTPALSTRNTCRVSSSTPRMSAQAPISRREALLAGAAVLLGIPGVALAKSGDSPKISVFGVGGASSPFTSGVQTGGTVQYKEFNPDEMAVFKRIVSESKDRLESAASSIKAKSWEDVRSRLRLEMSDLRKIVLKVNGALEGAAEKKASKAYLILKTDLENLDQAAIAKNQDKAYKAYNAAMKSLSAWQEVVGF